MSEVLLTTTRVQAGVWEAEVTAARGATAPPQIQALCNGVALDGLVLDVLDTAQGRWALRLPIPPSIIQDGTVTVLLREVGSDRTLAHMSLISGEPLDADIRVELDLLRAELDMLKKAFRRHCLET